MFPHLSVEPNSIKCISVTQPFSFFKYLEDNFGKTESIHRLFSLARSFNVKTLVIEEIPASGIIEKENNEIAEHTSDHYMKRLIRLTFWRNRFKSSKKINDCPNEDLTGYAILKNDVAPSLRMNNWHIFESLIRKYPHKNNCVPSKLEHEIQIDKKKFKIEGVKYYQQNGLNKLCAHVAIKTIVSLNKPELDLSYKKINKISESASGEPFTLGKGLSALQIGAVLKKIGLNLYEIDYTQMRKDFRLTHPYQQFLYSGIESGSGALLGFRLYRTESEREQRHIIPFYGHTFNKDTWAPDADISYFQMGKSISYIPSERWTSSFLGHDDNFGQNFCIPRLYIDREMVDYVVEILNKKVAYSGVQAEAIAVFYLNALYAQFSKKSQNKWIRRLATLAKSKNKRVVLRTISIKKDAFLSQLESSYDWSNHKENPLICERLDDVLPKVLWLIEVSLPHLFPANQRKVGDIVLNAESRPDIEEPTNYTIFLLARFPLSYYFISSIREEKPIFTTIPSWFTSHIPLFNCSLTK